MSPALENVENDQIGGALGGGLRSVVPPAAGAALQLGEVQAPFVWHDELSVEHEGLGECGGPGSDFWKGWREVRALAGLDHN